MHQTILFIYIFHPASPGCVANGVNRPYFSRSCYRTSHSKMCTEGVLKTIGIKHFNYGTAEAIIGWQKERWVLRFLERSWVLSLSRVWIQISQKFISAMVGVVCSWLARRCANTKVVVWLLKNWNYILVCWQRCLGSELKRTNERQKGQKESFGIFEEISFSLFSSFFESDWKK